MNIIQKENANNQLLDDISKVGKLVPITVLQITLYHDTKICVMEYNTRVFGNHSLIKTYIVLYFLFGSYS